MNLAALRTQVLSYGFDATAYASRVPVFLNDALNLIARRVDYFTDEAVQALATVAGTAAYNWPADMARMRELADLDRQTTLDSVTLRDVDRSVTSSGQPNWYALSGQTFLLYPTPDAVYNLEVRYWKMPAQLVADGDSPNLPTDWHRLLWMWAVMECYASEDDAQTAAYWKQRFDEALAEFAADVKFPSTDAPSQVRSMWDDGGLPGRGWSVYTGW